MPPPIFFISASHNFNTKKFAIKKNLSEMPVLSFSFNWDLILAPYAAGKRNLYYLGVIQRISHDDNFEQFLKRSGEKTFTIKDEDRHYL